MSGRFPGWTPIADKVFSVVRPPHRDVPETEITVALVDNIASVPAFRDRGDELLKIWG